jgi:hypothetical protein
MVGYDANGNAAWMLATHDQFIAQSAMKGPFVVLETGGGTTSRLWAIAVVKGIPKLET